MRAEEPATQAPAASRPGPGSLRQAPLWSAALLLAPALGLVLGALANRTLPALAGVAVAIAAGLLTRGRVHAHDATMLWAATGAGLLAVTVATVPFVEPLDRGLASTVGGSGSGSGTVTLALLATAGAVLLLAGAARALRRRVRSTAERAP